MDCSKKKLLILFLVFLIFWVMFSCTSYAAEDNTGENTNTDYTNQLEDFNRGQQELHNTITDDNVSNVDIDLPTDNTNDITEADFNKIFDKLVDVFTNLDYRNNPTYTFTLPRFTSGEPKTLTINTQSVFGPGDAGYHPGLYKIWDLVGAFWNFVVSLFIVKDIHHKIQKIKSGDIEKVAEGDVKADIL